MIALRNAHLAAELVQRAISNRNKRMPLPRLLCAPLALSEADLGVESEGLQSLLAKRREVEEEVSQLVGMAPLKAFLAELNAKVTYVERGGDPRLLEGCLNVVLTGESWDASRTGLLACVYRSLTRAAPQQLTPLRPLCRQPRRGEDDGGPPPLPRSPRVRYAFGAAAHLAAQHTFSSPAP